MERSSLGQGRQEKSRQKFIRISRRFFPNTMTFREYVEELNNEGHGQSARVSLESAEDDIHPAYIRLLDRLYVAWPSEKIFPQGIMEGLQHKGSVSMDQILHDVITTTLRWYPSAYDAQNKNVLCNGFTMGSRHGKGSMFRDLDVRSPSTPVQTFRSPAWKRLLLRVGHVLFRYLLMNNILLLSIFEDSTYKKGVIDDPAGHPIASVFLQLCGPLPRECDKMKRSAPCRTLSNIVLKQDLLYHTPTHRENTVSRSMLSAAAEGKAEKLLVPHSDGLPKSHHLQHLSCDRSSAKKLVRLIFPFQSYDKELSLEQAKEHKQSELLDFDRQLSRMAEESRSDSRGKRWLLKRNSSYRRLNGIVPLLEKVIRRTHKSSLRRVLGRLRPLPIHFREKTRDRLSVDCEELIKLSSTPKHVANYLIACTRHMLPTEIFGSEGNRGIFEKAVHSFIRRRLKRESFNVQQFCSESGVAVSHVKWLHRRGKNGRKISNPTDLRYRKARMAELYVWVFRGLLLPLVHQNFYVTESDLHRNRLFFFRREVWVKMIDAVNENILRTDRKFNILSKERLSECTSHRDSTLTALGSRICPYPVLLYHQLRFVPKHASLRGIQRPRGKMLRGFSGPRVHLGKHIGHNETSIQSPRNIGKAQGCMKKLFRHILRVLSSESHAGKSTLGASVFSLDDIYQKVLCLKSKWRRSNSPSMYVCSVDITTSFDTIPLETLFSDVIPPILTKERYACIRYGVSKPNLARDRIMQRCLTHVCSEPGEETSFARIVRSSLASDHAGSIFTDLVQVTTLTRDEILMALVEFLTNNVIAIPRRNRTRSETSFAVQCRGLPQGHPLSPLLTSLFYAHVENHDLSEFTLPTRSERLAIELESQAGPAIGVEVPNLLMRQVDDTIFLTASKDKAVKFLKRMAKGWKATHGFCVNIGKTRCNFKSGIGGKEDLKQMPWCGLIIDTSAMEIRVDYARYGQNRGGRLRDSLYIEQDRQVGQIFAERAWTCFKPKLHPLLFDGQINSRATVAVNIYQAALLASLKLSSYVVVILPTDRHLANVVETMLSKFISLVHRSVSSRAAVTRSCKLPLSPGEVRYLAIHAFHSGISKRLWPRRKMRQRIKPCQSMLDKQLEQAMTQLHRQREWIVEAAAKRIAETACHTLWSLKL